MHSENIKSKKVAMFIAFQDFRDEEYFIPKSVFNNDGFEVITVSTKKGQAIGVFGGAVDIDLTMEEIRADDYDALIFVGGEGMAKIMNSENLHALAREAVRQGKVLGAICIAPAVLAKSGVLSGKKATVWSNNMDKSAVKILKDNGACYTEKPVVVDGNLITANGPAVARSFAQAILETLSAK